MSLLRPRPCRLPIRPVQRTFSTTGPRAASLQIDRNDPDAVADAVPAYPHGPARWYKQSNRGLYGGQRIQFGNNVSGDFNTKTRRTFQANVLSKRLWSHALGRYVQVRVTARTLRTIDRVGGLDEYLLGDKASRIKQLGVSGWWLRWAIMQQPAVQARFRQEKKRLGLGPREEYEGELRRLEKSTVGADLEEAYAALPDEDEAEATAAAQARPEADAETAPVTLEEPLESDPSTAPSASVFAVTNPPGLPPLKFRTDRHTHVVLTSRGWVRTQPDTAAYSKRWTAQHRYPHYVRDRMATFTAELATLQRDEMPEMTLAEETEILRDARRRFTRELEGLADARVEMTRMGVVEARQQRGWLRELRERKGAFKREVHEAKLAGESDAGRAPWGAVRESLGEDREPDALGVAKA